MEHKAKSIRPFIGAKDFKESSTFYKELGFKEIPISHNMSYFEVHEGYGFYLQDAYVKDWVDNTMLFLEVDSVDRYEAELIKLDLHNKYKRVKLSSIVRNDWGSEIFLHDPSGILWHFGEFH
ncbi:glyoxalase [Roseivirga sp.]|uniref:glyoxalase n=1 Tax=Roseivirga sp. TaxID=1964215 RepID=UPI003B8C362C